MAINIYRSTDTSAPVLNGVAGQASLVNLLKKCLVEGYGDKTSLGQTLVDGTSRPGVATFKMPVGTSQCCLVVDDTSNANTNVARFRGFKDITVASMAVTDGYKPFPHDLNQNGGSYFYKSYTTTDVNRPWVLISDTTIFYLYSDINSDNGVYGKVMCFGDIESYSPNDKNACIGIGTDSDHHGEFLCWCGNQLAQGDHFIAASYDSISQCLNCGKSPINGLALNSPNTSVMGQSGQYLQNPCPITGNYYLTPHFIYNLTPMNNNNTAIIRGLLPGIQAPIHNIPFALGDTISGSSGTLLEGRTFEAFKAQHGSGPKTGVFLIETSDTQRTVKFR